MIVDNYVGRYGVTWTWWDVPCCPSPAEIAVPGRFSASSPVVGVRCGGWQPWQWDLPPSPAASQRSLPPRSCQPSPTPLPHLHVFPEMFIKQQHALPWMKQNGEWTSASEENKAWKLVNWPQCFAVLVSAAAAIAGLLLSGFLAKSVSYITLTMVN